MPPFAETCQNCGAPLETDREQDAWLCLDCLEEREDEEDHPDPLREPNCDQCGGPAREGFCLVCQA